MNPKVRDSLEIKTIQYPRKSIKLMAEKKKMSTSKWGNWKKFNKEIIYKA